MFMVVRAGKGFGQAVGPVGVEGGVEGARPSGGHVALMVLAGVIALRLDETPAKVVRSLGWWPSNTWVLVV